MLHEEGDDEIKEERLHTMTMDLISDLPDPIIHDIMSFLTTLDVTKLSILSKRFYFLWASFPVFDFDQTRFSRRYQGTLAGKTNGFLDHVLDSVLLRILLRRTITVLSEFRVNANLVGISADHRFDRAILAVLANGVRRMELNLGFASYMLPNEFASKSLSVLRLKGLQLDLCNLIQVCPSLTTVSLTQCVMLQDVNFSSKTLMEIELHCCSVKFIKINAANLHSFLFHASKKDSMPCQIDVLQCQKIMNLSLNNVVNRRDWIEKHANSLSELKTFILNGCQDIRHVKVWNEKLERVVISHCTVLTSIEVKAASLKSFMFEKAHDAGMPCNITFLASNCIKELFIAGEALITDQWLEAYLAIMTRLERLRLKVCNSLRNIKVCHEKLQNLEIYNCHGLVEADIDTPQLVSFMYHGNMIEVGKMVTRSSCSATLSMNQWISYDSASFCKWRKMLSFFGHCKALKLICSTHKEVMIPEIHRERLVSPLYDLQHLEIQIKSSQKIDSKLVDALLWLSPLPKTLHVSSGSRSRLQVIIKFVYNDMIEGEEDKIPFCCLTKPIKCWKHRLKSLEIQSSGVSPKNELIELQKYFVMNAKISDSLVSASV